MRRRDVIRTLSAGVVASSLPDAAVAQRRPGGRPNILWITCEDMSPDLGCWGDAYARTPNIDRLARASVRYTNAYATAPVCSPTRSCLITGVYATSLGTQNLRSAFPIPDFIRGFPSYLRAGGYFCSNNAKTDYNTSREGAIIKASWDECGGKAHWRQRQPEQ
ncbi:MAG: sulfatase-like hydrolase/transferase, partial [Armatimonadota bacterium]